MNGSDWISRTIHSYEQRWSDAKNWPQFKYIARPIYKAVASRSNTVAATAVSFFATDLLIHQLGAKTAKCILDNVISYPSSCDISCSPECSLIWMIFALPVMYAKYQKSLP